MFTAKRELLSRCLPEVMPILDEHWRELARNQDKIKLNPKYDTYVALEDSGAYRAYVVRAHDGEVAGYAGYILSRNLHYQDHIWATSDLFFVRKKFRRQFNLIDWILGLDKPKGAGTVLFDTIEDDLRQFGVSVMHSTYKLATPGTGKFLSRRGHSPIEMGMAKVLK